LGLDESRLAADRAARFSMIETFVAAELSKQIGWSGRAIRLCHYRQTSGVEVDFALEGRVGEIVGIEVKSSDTVTGHDFKSLRALAEAAGRRCQRSIVLYTGPEMLPFGTNLHALPLSALWGRLGRKS
jgi:predicted AAA+ superfamily ATPase